MREEGGAIMEMTRYPVRVIGRSNWSKEVMAAAGVPEIIESSRDEAIEAKGIH